MWQQCHHRFHVHLVLIRNTVFTLSASIAPLSISATSMQSKAHKILLQAHLPLHICVLKDSIVPQRPPTISLTLASQATTVQQARTP